MEWILFSPEDFGRVDYRDHLSLTGFWFVFCLSWKVWKFLNKGFLIVLFVVVELFPTGYFVLKPGLL